MNSLKFQFLILSTSVSLLVGVGRASSQITPPFVPSTGQSAPQPTQPTGQPSPTVSPSAPSGSAQPAPTGTAPTSDLLNTNGILNSVNQQIDAISKTVGETQAGLQQQAQQILNQPIVQQAQGVLNQIPQLGGQIADIGDRIGGLLSQFNLNNLLGLLNINLSKTAESVSGGLTSSGNQANTAGITPGALMLPDIEQARRAIQTAKSSATEEFFGTKTGGNGSPLVKKDLESLLMTKTTREVGEATALSAAGQKQLKANAEDANQALVTSAKFAENSKTQDVSQNILRNISGQMQASQQTGTLLAVDAQLRARDDSLRNIIISNTLDEIQGANLAKRRTDASAYSAAITQGAQFMLPGVSAEEQP